MSDKNQKSGEGASNSDVVRIAITGDTHLLDSQYASARRGEDFRSAFLDMIMTICHVEKPTMAILTGDIFDKRRPSPQIVGTLMEADMELRKAGIPMVAVTGNHDMIHPTWLETLFPGRDGTGCGIIPADDRRLEIRGKVIYGIAHRSPSQFRTDIDIIRTKIADADVVVYHGYVLGVVDSFEATEALRVSDFPLSHKTKILALGDIHISGEVTYGQTLALYPGSTEMKSSSEATEKTYTIVELGDSVRVVKKVPIKNREKVVAKVRDQTQADSVIEEIRRKADAHPLVLLEFDREIKDFVTRVYNSLDASKAIIRCTALPVGKEHQERQKQEEGETLLLRDFVDRHFKDRPHMTTFVRSLVDAQLEEVGDLTSEFIESRKKQLRSTAVS